MIKKNFKWIVLLGVVSFGVMFALFFRTSGPRFTGFNGAADIVVPVKAYKFAFDPGSIEVTLGQKVELQVTATDVAHGLGIKGYNVEVYIAPGKMVPIRFIADKPGTFQVYCSYRCGSGHGRMKGTFIVR